MPEPPAATKLGPEDGGWGLGAPRGPASEQAVRRVARPALSAGLEDLAWWPRRPLPGAAGARQDVVPVRSAWASSQGLRGPVGEEMPWGRRMGVRCQPPCPVSRTRVGH